MEIGIKAMHHKKMTINDDKENAMPWDL